MRVPYRECMSVLSYFSNRNAEIGPVASVILRQFVTSPYLSTYQIYKSLKGTRDGHSNMAYKDVHKRIKRLDSLQLIEKVSKEEIHTPWESIHAPIYYRLTTGGIFNLLYKNKSFMIYKGRAKIFQNYANNIIFKTFLYPYFAQATLIKIKSSYLFTEIFGYLLKCCEFTNALLEEIDKVDHDLSEVITMPLFEWDKFPGNYDKGIIKLIEHEVGIKFSGQPRIEKDKDNKTIKISNKSNSVIIRLDDKKDKAILTTDDGKSYDLPVEQSKNKLIINKPIGTMLEAYIEKFRHHIAYSILILAFSIIVGTSEAPLVGASELDIDDVKMLSQDPKTANLLEKTYNIFRDRYEFFLGLKKEIGHN